MGKGDGVLGVDQGAGDFRLCPPGPITDRVIDKVVDHAGGFFFVLFAERFIHQFQQVGRLIVHVFHVFLVPVVADIAVGLLQDAVGKPDDRDQGRAQVIEDVVDKFVLGAHDPPGRIMHGLCPFLDMKGVRGLVPELHQGFFQLAVGLGERIRDALVFAGILAKFLHLPFVAGGLKQFFLQAFLFLQAFFQGAFRFPVGRDFLVEARLKAPDGLFAGPGFGVLRRHQAFVPAHPIEKQGIHGDKNQNHRGQDVGGAGAEDCG